MSSRAELAALLFAREHHPDPDVRARIAEHLAGSLGADAATLDVTAFRSVLAAARGTVLEPFVIEPQDMALATELFGYAAPRGESLRVVSRDKLMPEGGLVIEPTTAGAAPTARYAECVADRVVGAPSTAEVWSFSPGHTPSGASLRTVATGARAVVVADGHGLRVLIGPLGTAPSGPFGAIPADARTSADGRPLEAIGGSAMIVSSGEHLLVEVRPSGPEATIRLTSAMAARAWVTVRFGREITALSRVDVRLDVPAEDGPVELVLIRVMGTTTETRLTDWVSTPANLRLPVPDASTVRAIADRTAIAAAWITPDLLGEYA